MNIAFKIASRYLFSRKSHNAINIISGISSVGVCVGTIALICVLSVFNGFGKMVEGLFGEFDPDIKITSVVSKSFVLDDKWEKIKNIEGIANCVEVVSENVLFRFKDKQLTGTAKGVGEEFEEATGVKRILVAGGYMLNDSVFNYGVVGVGVAAELGFVPHLVDPLFIYAPKREGKVNLATPENSFITERVFVSGVFSVQQSKYDNELVIIPIDLARSLFGYKDNEVSAMELSLKPGTDSDEVREKIADMLGDDYSVKDKYEQQEEYFKIMKIEKWITFLILSFILLIAIFNIIGSLSMLIIDKTADINTLRNLGADQGLIRKIFLMEGWMISLIGCVVGLIIGCMLCVLQANMGLITVPMSGGGSMPYPINLEFTDVLLVFVSVGLMGLIAAYYPASKIQTRN